MNLRLLTIVTTLLASAFSFSCEEGVYDSKVAMELYNFMRVGEAPLYKLSEEEIDELAKRYEDEVDEQEYSLGRGAISLPIESTSTMISLMRKSDGIYTCFKQTNWIGVERFLEINNSTRSTQYFCDCL